MELAPIQTSILPVIPYPYLWGGWGDDCYDDCYDDEPVIKKVDKTIKNANNNINISNSVIVVANVETDISVSVQFQVLLDVLSGNNIDPVAVLQLLVDAKLITPTQITEATNRVNAKSVSTKPKSVNVMDLLKNLKVPHQ